MDSLRTAHVHGALPVVAVDIVNFESLDEGRKSGFEPNRGEGIILHDIFVVDPQELTHDREHSGTYLALPATQSTPYG